MLRQPSEGLAAGIRLAADVCCRRCIFEHGVVGVILTSLARVGAQPLDAQVAESETFDFGDIYGSIAVDKVGGRAVCLVTCDGSVLVGPCRPLLCEILQQQVGQCLAVVADHLHVGTHQFGQVFFQFVAASLLELFEERRCPCGISHLIAVVEECVRVGGTRAFKGLLNVTKIIRHSLAVKMVDNQSLTAGSCPFHLHDSVTDVQGDDAPLSSIGLFCGICFLLAFGFLAFDNGDW